MATLVTWEVLIKAADLAEAEKQMAANIPETRAFKGCQGIECFKDQNNPNRLILIEYWDSFDDYQKYVQWRKDTGVLSNFMAMVEGSAIVRSFDKVDG